MHVQYLKEYIKREYKYQFTSNLTIKEFYKKVEDLVNSNICTMYVSDYLKYKKFTSFYYLLLYLQKNEVDLKDFLREDKFNSVHFKGVVDLKARVCERKFIFRSPYMVKIFREIIKDVLVADKTYVVIDKNLNIKKHLAKYKLPAVRSKKSKEYIYSQYRDILKLILLSNIVDEKAPQYRTLLNYTDVVDFSLAMIKDDIFFYKEDKSVWDWELRTYKENKEVFEMIEYKFQLYLYTGSLNVYTT